MCECVPSRVIRVLYKIYLPAVVNDLLIAQKNKSLDKTLADFRMQDDAVLLQEIDDLLGEFGRVLRIAARDLADERNKLTELLGFLGRLEAENRERRLVMTVLLQELCLIRNRISLDQVL